MTAQFRSNLGKFLTSHHASLQNKKCKQYEMSKIKRKLVKYPKEVFECVAVTGAINQNIPEIETQI